MQDKQAGRKTDRLIHAIGGWPYATDFLSKQNGGRTQKQEWPGQFRRCKLYLYLSYDLLILNVSCVFVRVMLLHTICVQFIGEYNKICNETHRSWLAHISYYCLATIRAIVKSFRRLGLVGRPQTSSSPPVIFIAGRPKAALLFWFFDDFRCGALLFMVIHVIYKYKNK